MSKFKLLTATVQYNLHYCEEDSGLWIVRHDDGRELGAIYDRGSKVSGCVVDGYDALDCWDSCVPGRLVGSAKTFQGALKVLRTWIEQGSPRVTELPNYHPSKQGHEESIQKQLKRFVLEIANNGKDAIWQDQWFALRGRAAGLAAKFGGKV